MTSSRALALLLFSLAPIAACGGPAKPTPRPVATKVDDKPVKKPTPPPPPCVKAGDAAVWAASADDGSATFCTGERDGAKPDCFTVDLASGDYARTTVDAAAAEPAIKVETTATEVSVCLVPAAGEEPADGEDPAEAPAPTCTVIKPKVAKGSEDQLVAVANAKTAVIMVGQAAEVWDLKKNKRLTSIKFQKGDNACGTPTLLGETIFINAKACEGPSARGALYNLKGKKIADVGGKSFGTYGESGLQAVQIDGSTYAFLEEYGAQVVVQDVVKGKVAKTIDISALWAAGAAPATEPVEGEEPVEPAAAIGNPGTSLLTMGGSGKVVVVSGSPTPGNLAVVDTAEGTAKILAAPVCK